MDIVLNIIRIVFLAFLAIAAGVPLYALPATFSLPSGLRPGIEKLTIQEAARRLQVTGKRGWDLVEAARALVADRMQYSRRNSFDPAPRAFERGYGYCQQHAYALVGLLSELGIEANVVHAFRNEFPDDKVGGHAWVRVKLDGETRDIDSLHYDTGSGQLNFTPLTMIHSYTPHARAFFGWGAAMVNAHRYYVTGKDR